MKHLTPQVDGLEGHRKLSVKRAFRNVEGNKRDEAMSLAGYNLLFADEKFQWPGKRDGRLSCSGLSQKPAGQ
jgi:hypothetical protein